MTQPLDRTRPTSPADKLQYAIDLAKAGRKVEARDVLRRVVALQPVDQAAWLWLSAVATEQAEAEAALTQARQINPTHPSLAQAEQWLMNRFSPKLPTVPIKVVATVPTPPAAPLFPPEAARNLPNFFNIIALGVVALALLVGLLVLFLGLALEVNATTPDQLAPALAKDDLWRDRPAALDTAWAERDWTRAITILEGLRQIQPNSPSIKDQLSHAYLQKGIALRHKGFIEEARPYFEQALLVTPDQLRAQQELRLASDYLAGIEHYQAGRWLAAIKALQAVRSEVADYAHVKDLLYSAYFNQGLALQAAAKMPQARQALEAAIALRPDLPEPRRQIAEIEFALAPETPPTIPIGKSLASRKLIVVSVAEQRMIVYEGNEKVFDFVVSTGEPGSDTAIGEFEILDKIDVAYASNWNLDMPYWMGIYWAGSLENGIHSLPIVRHTGYKLWDGYLGQRVSYGCVILGDEDAATLYEWAEVGTKVKIVPSLAYWSSSSRDE